MSHFSHHLTRPLLIGLISSMTPMAQGAIKPLKINIKLNVNEAKESEDHEKKLPADPPSARIILLNGDQLKGTPQDMDENGMLTFDAQSLTQPTIFTIKNILSLNLDQQETQKPTKTLARITLQPRFRETSSDTILGSLSELTPETIKLDTWYSGPITLKRSMVKSLNIINNGPGNFFGPNNLNEWTLSKGEGTWKFHNGTLTSLSSGGIGRDVGLRDKSHISFDASWTQSMRFRLQLYSCDVSTDRPDAYYDINFNRNYTFLRTYGKFKNKARPAGGGRWQQIRMLPDANRAHFDIFANRTLGTFTIYIDGAEACLLQSQRPNPENLGTGFSIVAEKGNHIQISDISITPWNGNTLLKNAKIIEPQQDDNENADNAESEDQEKPNKQPHKIILNNGDEVPGTVGKVQDGRMTIETEFTPILIPIKRIKSLSLGDQGEEPKKYAGDVRAWFQQGGHITLKLTSLKDGKLTGFSQATGSITVDLTALNRIDFHIYDPQANALREKHQ